KVDPAGHKAQVHAAAFVRANERLLTADAEGFVVVWDLTIMRPRALIAWKLAADDEPRLSTCLPLDSSPEPRPQPWILHMLEVNTMNFCSFAHCPAAPMLGPDSSERPEILIAVPNTLASEAIDIFHLPSQSRLHTVRLGDKNGMVMALALYSRARYQAKSHSQPVLSLDISPGRDYFLTSSADSVIAKTSTTGPNSGWPRHSSSSSSKQQRSSLGSASTGSSGRSGARRRRHYGPAPTNTGLCCGYAAKGVQHQALGPAEFEGAIRVYSAKTLKELAVLKWHQTGCYAAAFAEIEPGAGGGDGDEEAEITETPTPPRATANPDNSSGEVQTQVQGGGRSSGTLVPKLVALTVRDKRIRQAKTAHWLAAGSKDGKVSLWDIF
ncbi:hypothetical protein B0T24DRAFT_644704, partial [Lasiosphaeria ovina]